MTANLADQDAELERRAEALCLELGKEGMSSDVVKANGGMDPAHVGYFSISSFHVNIVRDHSISISTC